MSDGFAVDDAALDRHAAAAATAAERLHAAAQAGRPLDIAAYGLVGQIFASAAIDAAAAGSAAVADLAAHAAALAGGVRATRAAYADVEERAVTTFGSAR